MATTSVATVVPASSSAFVDVRDEARAMRVTWHGSDGIFVFSMWREGRCAATFQLERESVPELINSLVTNLATTPPAAPTVTRLPL